MSRLMTRPPQRANTSAAENRTPARAGESPLDRSSLRSSMQPEALAATSSAPPASIEHDIDEWLERNLPMADQISAGFIRRYGQRNDAAQAALRLAANEIRNVANRRSTRLKIQYSLPVTTLPDAVGRLEALEDLSLIGTGLQSLPDNLRQLSQLRRLHVANSPNLHRLPPSLTRLANLNAMELIGVPLQELPADLGRMQSLRSLKLAGGHYEQLPASLVDLRQLTDLRLSISPHLRKLPENIGVMRRLRFLEVSSAPKLSQLPHTLTQLHGLEKLHLNGSRRLSELPEDIGRMRGLRELSLKGCSALQHLPDSVGDLSQLQVLDLRSTGLRTLPPSLARLPATCDIKVPGHLFTQLAQIRNPRRTAQPRASRMQRSAMQAMPTVQEAEASWNHRPESTRVLHGIDPGLGQHFEKWMQGLAHNAKLFGGSLTPADMRMLDQLVAEAIASAQFRSSFSQFLSEHTIERLDMDGRAQLDVAGPAVRGDIKTAFSEMLTHKLMHMDNHTAALRLLQQTLQSDEFGLSRENLLQDRNALTGRSQMWPPLKAYITMHDALGREAQDAASTLLISKFDEAQKGLITEAEAMQQSKQTQADATRYTEERARDVLTEWGIQ